MNLNSNSPDKCPLCGGLKKEGKTTFTADLGFGVIVVREVPATVCSQCGSDWLSSEVSEQLEKTVLDAKKHQHQISVSVFEKKAS